MRSCPREVLQFVREWLGAGPPSLRRLAVLGGFLFLYPLVELVVWAGLLADEIFFRGYRRCPVRAPVFIIGNFRSGTTYLHRLLARDTTNFATMVLWQILFAPSVTAQVAAQAVAMVLAPARRLLARARQGWDTTSHRISFLEPEEDDYLLLHVFQALTVGLAAGLPALARPYAHFDRVIPRKRRVRLMRFYASCVKRFLFLRGDGRCYLAKNPALTPKMGSVLEEFPDARFIVLLRDPARVLPSVSSMMRTTWRILGVPDRDPRLKAFLLETVTEWFRHPAALARHVPVRQMAFVHYDDLVRDPEGTIHALYEHLELKADARFCQTLAQEAETARLYSSRHAYSAAEEGFDSDTLRLVSEEVRRLYPRKQNL